MRWIMSAFLTRWKSQVRILYAPLDLARFRLFLGTVQGTVFQVCRSTAPPVPRHDPRRDRPARHEVVVTAPDDGDCPHGLPREYVDCYTCLTAERDALRAEVERLREHERLPFALDMAREISALRAENERLRAALERIVATLPGEQAWYLRDLARYALAPARDGGDGK